MALVPMSISVLGLVLETLQLTHPITLSSLLKLLLADSAEIGFDAGTLTAPAKESKYG
jgi:hypothetical protein